MSVREALGAILFSLLLAVLFIIGSCRSAHAQMDRTTTAFVFMVPVYTWQSVIDARTTTQCVNAGTCREVNPVWLAIARTDGIEKSMRAKFYAQTALTVGTAIAMHKWPQHKKPLVLSYALMLGLQVWVNQHNAAVLRKVGW